jgi:nonsense-mediated mRNA decay protein 3
VAKGKPTSNALIERIRPLLVKRFCYRCGALESEAGSLIDGLCQKCFLETVRVDLPDRVDLTVCGSCGSFFVGGSWLKVLEGEAVRMELLRQVKPPGLDLRVRLDGDLAQVSVTGKLHEKQRTPLLIEKSVRVRRRFITCRPCSLRRGGRYEAVVQVRGIPSAEVSRILREFEHELLISDEDFFPRVDQRDNGADVYASTVSLARRLSSLLREMGAKVTSTSKLVGQTKDGRRRYRPTFLASFLEATDLSPQRYTEKG